MITANDGQVLVGPVGAPATAEWPHLGYVTDGGLTFTEAPRQPVERWLWFIPIPEGAPTGFRWDRADLSGFIGRSCSLAMHVADVEVMPARPGFVIASAEPVDDGQRLRIVAERYADA
ncbi:hypothetical protein GCM10010399_44360 [Dactylosporangium fulvum]|uniref:Uncharacterized protein n=1 Tax=Dactylosporangium fulvum TaxID=53359 RepID=A0ABY5W9A9_9ACTN|nr:hypothetical protein [Dactylosporangium fulvum]UWP85896.1 hypothetical protein Dfulv_17255 [Dactylosporangium fulvum]